jgi:hypothetical protein
VAAGVTGRLASVVLFVALAGLTLGGCGAAATRATPAAPTDVVPSYSPAIADTRGQVARALAVSSLQLQDARQPFLPPESPSLAAAPRGIFQVLLPDDPSHGFIVIYEFRDAAAAALAGHEQALYIASGPGRVQFPLDTQSLIRQAGTTLVVYNWSPANSTDVRAAAIFTDLGTVGTGIDIPR